MMEFQDKRKLKNFIYSKYFIIIFAILIIFLSKSVWSVYKKQAVTKENLARATAGLNDLQIRDKKLSSEIQRLGTKGGTESEIREKYGLVKPGEEVIIIVNKNEETDFTLDNTEISFWQKIKNWLK